MLIFTSLGGRLCS